jgi:drug/metabolite transporter (DMT)-like permease
MASASTEAPARSACLVERLATHEWPRSGQKERTALSPAVIFAVLSAAALHAGWNAMTKHASDRLALIGRMSLVGSGVAMVLLPWVDRPDPRSWAWLGGSAVIHTAYTLLLVAAYRIGDFNQAYPVSRGVGPLIVALFAVLILGERLTASAQTGIGLVAGGVMTIGVTSWDRVRANLPALAVAALTGVTIAAYTLVDGIGVRHSSRPVGYALWLVALQGVLIALGTVVLKRSWRWPDSATTRRAAPWRLGAGVGCMAALGYGLVLWAQFSGALAVVAALREVSVVFAAIIGVLIFREPAGRRRMVGSLLVATGCVLLAVPGS